MRPPFFQIRLYLHSLGLESISFAVNIPCAKRTIAALGLVYGDLSLNTLERIIVVILFQGYPHPNSGQLLWLLEGLQYSLYTTTSIQR